MASPSVAVAKSASAAATNVTVHPPASPFASLLRRSKFASFDPLVRQTYSTPPSHASRGSWGLKKPLSLRRRNAFISLPAQFEDKAQFIEWSRAEDEVRFIRRFEEMQVRPLMVARTPWAKTLGTKNSAEWIMDSEFAWRHEGVESEEAGGGSNANLLKIEQAAASAVPESLEGLGLGEGGKGNYGHRRALATGNVVRLSPNIDAMLPHEFEAYIRRLRSLRPQFKQYLSQIALGHARERKALEDEIRALERQIGKGDKKKKTELSNKKEDLKAKRKKMLDQESNLYRIAQERDLVHHRKFIESYTASKFAEVDPSPSDNLLGDSVVIEQRPHQVGGLLYTHLTPLHSQLFSAPQPGIVLQTISTLPVSSPSSSSVSVVKSGSGTAETMFIASLGGLTPLIAQENRGDKLPLLNHNDPTDAGIRREKIKQSVAKMRLLPTKVFLERPPISVGDPKEAQTVEMATSGVDKMKMRSEAMVVGAKVMFSQSNPYKPGTMEYVALQPVMGKGASSPLQTAITPAIQDTLKQIKGWKKNVVNHRMSASGTETATANDSSSGGVLGPRAGSNVHGKTKLHANSSDLLSTLKKLSAMGTGEGSGTGRTE